MSNGNHYIPDRGDIIGLSQILRDGTFAPVRFACTISPKSYNLRTTMALFCPISSHGSGYPFEVPLQGVASVQGVILADQIRNLALDSFHIEPACTLPADVLIEVLRKLKLLIDF